MGGQEGTTPVKPGGGGVLEEAPAPPEGPKRHGCDGWPNAHQLACSALFLTLLACFYAVLLPVVRAGVGHAAWVGLLVVHSVLAALTVGLYLFCCYSDAADPAVWGAHDPGDERYGDFWCATCNVSVLESSKHCRQCRKCIQGFDHHCKWLDNCVGEGNYVAFFSLLCCCTTLVTFQAACVVYVLVRYSTDGAAASGVATASGTGASDAHGGYIAGLSVLLFVGVVAVYFVGELLVFHLVLVYRGMTTLEYIFAMKAMEDLAAAEVEAGRPPPPEPGCCGPSSAVAPSDAAQRPKKMVEINPCQALCVAPTPTAKLVHHGRLDKEQPSGSGLNSV